MMKFVLWAICGLYGCLSGVAALTQLGNRDMNIASTIIMIIGGFGLSGAVILSILRKGFSKYLAAVGLVLIAASALWNGIAGGNPQVSHHILRLIFSTVAVLGFFRVSKSFGKGAVMR